MVKKLVGITTTGRDLIELIGVILQPTSAGAALSALPDSPELLVCSYDWKCPLSLQVDTSELCPHNENGCVFEGCLDGHRRTLTLQGKKRALFSIPQASRRKDLEARAGAQRIFGKP